jgi:hypothetical protein
MSTGIGDTSGTPSGTQGGQEGDKRGAGSKCEATHDTGMVTLACTRRPGHPSLHFDGHYWLSWG